MGVALIRWREKEEICQDFFAALENSSGCHMQREFTGGIAGGYEAEGPVQGISLVGVNLSGPAC